MNDILVAEFELLRQEIVLAYEASGMKTSGSWGTQVQVEARGNRVAISVPGYINGRRPGTPPPSDAIEQWIVQKGIGAQLEKGMTTGSLAFLIARKIGREGWTPKQGNIAERIATPERIQQILDKVSDSRAEDITAEILAYLTTATA